MTKIERLKIYKKMLRDYRISNIPIIGKYFREKFYTYSGFCVYIYKNINSNWSIKAFIELYKLKPRYMYDTVYWFKEGDLKPRIELLKKAISDTKMHIEIERLMLEK